MRASFSIPLANQTYRIYFIALLVLFILSIFIEKGTDILWINGNHSPFLDAFFKTYTNLGDGLIFLPVLVIMLFIRYQYAIIGATVSILHGIIISVFKQLLFTDAPRPRGYMDNELIHFVSGVAVHSAHSFPSGHTATAFCLALFVSYVCRNQWVALLMLSYALLVGYSRIYLAQHFFIDVAAGAIIGSFTTFSMCLVFEANEHPQWMTNRLALPIKNLAVRR